MIARKALKLTFPSAIATLYLQNVTDLVASFHEFFDAFFVRTKRRQPDLVLCGY